MPNSNARIFSCRSKALFAMCCVSAACFGVTSRSSADIADSAYAWGSNNYGQCAVGSFYENPFNGVNAIACGNYHTIALKGDAVLAWGLNTEGQCTIPASAQSGVSVIACGGNHTIAINNGEVLAWGRNIEGQCTIPVSAQSGVSAIAGGGKHTPSLSKMA